MSHSVCVHAIDTVCDIEPNSAVGSVTILDIVVVVVHEALLVMT